MPKIIRFNWNTLGKNRLFIKRKVERPLNCEYVCLIRILRDIPSICALFVQGVLGRGCFDGLSTYLVLTLVSFFVVLFFVLFRLN